VASPHPCQGYLLLYDGEAVLLLLEKIQKREESLKQNLSLRKKSQHLQARRSQSHQGVRLYQSHDSLEVAWSAGVPVPLYSAENSVELPKEEPFEGGDRQVLFEW